jgi:hypothetical protein
MMKKEWLAFVDNPSMLNLGNEVELVIKDLDPGVRNYESHRVLAIVQKGEEGEGDSLRIRSATGVLYADTYKIRILEERKLVPTRY